MGSFANTLFTIMLGWLQTAASAIWSAFTTENGGAFLQWIGRNWIVIAAVLCVIGLALDLGVYLLRWRPMRVWKSFINRLRHKEEVNDEEIPAAEAPASGRLFQREEEPTPPAESKPVTMGTEQEDFSRWITEEPEPETEKVQRKPIITGAGYTVPADSPYRRPAEPAADGISAEPVQDEYPPEETETRPEVMTQRKRRRRLIVSDLFNDPEEELYQYEMPQQLIDKNKAYHQPVYPKGWKRDEGEKDEPDIR